MYNGSPAVMPIFGFGRGGVPAALVARGDASRPDSTFFDFEYDVPSTAKIGSVQESGVGFTAAGLVPQEWQVMDGAAFEIVEGPAICRPTTGNM